MSARDLIEAAPQPNATPLMARYWINQPSRLQPDHKLHGERVIGPAKLAAEARPVVTVYFTHGPVSSSEILKQSLSPGWPSTGQARPSVGVTNPDDGSAEIFRQQRGASPEGQEVRSELGL